MISENSEERQRINSRRFRNTSAVSLDPARLGAKLSVYPNYVHGRAIRPIYRVQILIRHRRRRRRRRRRRQTVIIIARLTPRLNYARVSSFPIDFRSCISSI